MDRYPKTIKGKQKFVWEWQRIIFFRTLLEVIPLEPLFLERFFI